MYASTSARLLAVFLCLLGGACSKKPKPAPTSDTSTTQAAPQVEAKPKPKKCKFKGKVEKDVTLYKECSPYIIKGGIDVLANVTMTIEAGVEMRFRDGDWFEISAASQSGARLIAKGTAEDPIILTSQDESSTADKTWLGLWFAEGTRDSILSHVVIRAAGGDNTFLKPPLVQGCLTLTNVKPGAVIMEDVRVEGCVNAGVVLQKSEPTMRRVTVRNVDKGFLLDGVNPKLVPADTHYENVKRQIVSGPTLL